MAQGILTGKLKEKKINAVVDSAGTASYHIGDHPDPRTIVAAGRHGVDISSYRAKQFSYDFFGKFDIIYAMDMANYRDLAGRAKTGEEKAKVKLLLDELHPGSGKGVPDPWYGGDAEFEKVFKLLDDVCNKVAEKLMEPKFN